MRKWMITLLILAVLAIGCNEVNTSVGGRDYTIKTNTATLCEESCINQYNKLECTNYKFQYNNSMCLCIMYSCEGQ